MENYLYNRKAMITVKFRRIGKKHQASYRLIVSEKGSKLAGRFLEDLGFYNPHTKEARIDGEKVTAWIKKGAQPSDTVFNLLVTRGIIEGKKRAIAKVAAKKDSKQAQELPEEKSGEKEGGKTAEKTEG